MLGVYELSIRKISFETSIDSKTVRKALEAFERIGKVRYTKNYIILLNFAKHQNYNTNMKKSAIDTYNNLPKELRINDEEISKDNPSEGFERVLKCLGMVRKIEVEIEDESEIEEEKEQNTNVFSEEVNSTYYSILNFFDESTHPDTDSQVNNWKDTIDKLNRLDGLTFDDIFHLIKVTRNDEFWSKNFLSVTKLRKKNPDQIPYWKVFYNKFKNQNNGKQLTKSQERMQRLADW